MNKNFLIYLKILGRNESEWTLKKLTLYCTVVLVSVKIDWFYKNMDYWYYKVWLNIITIYTLKKIKLLAILIGWNFYNIIVLIRTIMYYFISKSTEYFDQIPGWCLNISGSCPNNNWMVAPTDSISFKFEFALTHHVEPIVYLDRIEGYI